jgi:hypothetical protein
MQEVVGQLLEPLVAQQDLVELVEEVELGQLGLVKTVAQALIQLLLAQLSDTAAAAQEEMVHLEPHHMVAQLVGSQVQLQVLLETEQKILAVVVPDQQLELVQLVDQA